MALRVMTSIRVADIIQIQLLAVRKCASDSSPYVRKCAANAISKIYKLDPDQAETLHGLIEKLLRDSSTSASRWHSFRYARYIRTQFVDPAPGAADSGDRACEWQSRDARCGRGGVVMGGSVSDAPRPLAQNPLPPRRHGLPVVCRG